MEFLYEYGLFLAKAATLVIAILLVVGGVIGLASKQKGGKGHLLIESVNDKLDDIAEQTRALLLTKDELKALHKEEKKKAKQAKKDEKNKPEEKDTSRLFVIDFKGSMDAHEVERLRKEVTAVLLVADKQDEVLVKLESGGGVVHGYGLAASQLQRLKDAGLKLTVSVDKVAASGGYMMACVADEILAANFAIIGSIGVIAQLPNFNKLLKRNDIEFEQHTAGEFKRTLTVFGENTDAGREKFREELEDVHHMFKDHVAAHRANMDIAKVATGEYWYGNKALELGLVDKLQTSDDYLLQQYKEKQVFTVKYEGPKNLAEKLGKAAAVGVEKGLMGLWQKSLHYFK